MTRMALRFRIILLISLLLSLASAQTSQSNRPKLEWEKRIPLDYPADAKAKGIEGQVVLAVSINEEGTVTDEQVISGPPELAPAAIDAVKQWKAKPYVVDGKPIPLKIKLPLDFHLSNGPLQVPPMDAEHRLIKQVRPEYPSLARQSHQGGEVVLRALIGTDGKVKELAVVSGPPLFRQSALDSVKQWEYRPWVENGRPEEFQTTITVTYWIP